MGTALEPFVRDFAAALKAADALGPEARSARSARVYHPGLGPHGENAAIVLVLAQLAVIAPGYVCGTQIAYPDSPREKCDLVVGSPLEWAIETKMVRPMGDNGKPDDTYLKDLLSPYPQDRSAIGDARKLRASKFRCRKAILVYGFDHDQRPLRPVLDAMQTLMLEAGNVAGRIEAQFADLVHPVHRHGCVVAWEVL